MAITLSSTPDRDVLVADSVERRQAHAFVENVPSSMLDTFTAQTRSGQVSVPSELSTVLRKVVEVLASGGTVTIGSLPEDLTTTVAAEQLGISRPTLMKMIRAGDIPAHKVGSHTRLKSADVLGFRRARLEAQRKAFDELRALEAELDVR
jgi:excisionase family DNA binding protein